MRIYLGLMATLILFCFVIPGVGQTTQPTTPDSRFDAIERRLSELEKENARLRAELAARPTVGPSTAAVDRTTKAVLDDAAGRSSGHSHGHSIDLDVGVEKGVEIKSHDSESSVRLGANFDFLGQTRDFGPREDKRRLSMREVELSAEARINPWLYGVVFLTRPEGEAFNIEEAYADIGKADFLKARVGFGRIQFGYLNTIHEPERPQVSIPLSIVEFLGEEQLREGNVTLGRLFELGNGHRAGASVAILNSDNEVALNSGAGIDKAYTATVNYGYSSTSYAYQLDASVLTGNNDARDNLRTTTGVLAGRLYLDPNYNEGYDFPARFSLFAELLYNRRELDNSGGGPSDNNSLGTWVVADYQFAKSHHVGVGYEYTQGLTDNDLTAQAFSAHYSWYFTGHSRVQFEVRHVDPAEGDAGWEALLQFNVVLGPHGERPFLPILDIDAYK